MEDASDLPHLVSEFGKLLGENRLHSVRERPFRFVMDFDQKAISTHSYGGAREGSTL